MAVRKATQGSVDKCDETEVALYYTEFVFVFMFMVSSRFGFTKRRGEGV